VSEHSPVLRDHGYHSLRVARVVSETHDASSFVLDVPGDLAETFRYTPGQFCTFRVHIDGEEQLRSYSMSSAPATDRDLTVTVKRVPGGLVSNWLLDHVAAGDHVEATKPAGVFCPQESPRPVVAFCGGSGITPVISIAKHVLAETRRPVRLLYANRDRDSVIFADALTGLRGAQPQRLDLRHHFDTDDGFLASDAITNFVGSELDADFYICGPGPFMDLVEAALEALNVAPERIFIERFLVQQQEKTDALLVDDAGGGPGAAAVPDEVTVILGGRTTVIPYRPGDTLIETARRGGLRPPFSCEAGNCATCMAILKEGSVTMRANNALTPEEVEEGWVLTCQSVPSGPAVVVEYEAM
jgi:3-ketosteroid 9alpha-monooxygenase subunit B